jgi:N utilization substance protein A
MFMDALDVDDVIAHLLVAEGFVSLEQVAFVPVAELAEIEGFDEEVAEELRLRARSHLEEEERQADESRRALGVEDAVAEVDGLDSAMVVKLGEGGIKTLDDLADLASDELLEILGDAAPTPEQADAIIMAARAHWFEGEESPEAEDAALAQGAEQGDAVESGETPAGA